MLNGKTHITSLLYQRYDDCFTNLVRTYDELNIGLIYVTYTN